MATIFFKITDQQENEVQQLMQAEGYTSKAEFFRFLIKFYKYKKTPEQENFEKAAKELGDVLMRLKKQDKLPGSLEDQLADV